MNHTIRRAVSAPTHSGWVPLATDTRDQFYARVPKEVPRMAESPEARLFTHKFLDGIPVNGKRAAL